MKFIFKIRFFWLYDLQTTKLNRSYLDHLSTSLEDALNEFNEAMPVLLMGGCNIVLKLYCMLTSKKKILLNSSCYKITF